MELPSAFEAQPNVPVSPTVRSNAGILPTSDQFRLFMQDSPEANVTPTVLAQWLDTKNDALKRERSSENTRLLGNIIEEGARLIRDMAARDELIPSYLLWSIGELCNTRFDFEHQLEDIDLAIECFVRLSVMAPQDHGGRTVLHRYSAKFFEKRFKATGQLQDLDSAFESYVSACATASTSVQKVKSLFDAGNLLSQRSFLTRSQNDLNHAITMLEESVTLGRDLEGIRRPGTLLTTLGIRLRDRYYMSRSKDDIHRALSMCQQAEDTIPPGKFHASIHRNLARTHLTMYTAIKKQYHIEQAFKLFRHIWDNLPESHDDWPQASLDMSTVFWYLYSSTDPRRPEYLDNAIQFAQVLVDNDPRDIDALYALGQMLATRSPQREPVEGKHDHEEAAEILRMVMDCQNADPELRFASGRMLSRMLYDNDAYQQAWETIKTLFHESPLASPPSTHYRDYQWIFSEHYASGFASEAAVIALAATNNPLDALDCLERGSRQLVTAFDKLFAETTELPEIRPDLNRSFLKLQMELRQGSATPSRRHQAGKELEILCCEIRQQPGLEKFLLPPTRQKLCETAVLGPLVVINSLPDRSDAILIQEDQIRSLRLPDLRHEDVVKRASDGDLASIQTLEWLWRSVCGVVLDTLGFTQAPVDGVWPRVWWIPIGELSRFPFHAAGLHRDSPGDTVLDRVMSSYALLPSIVLRNREARTSTQPSSQKQALLVAMPWTKNRPPLEKVQIEIDRVQSMCHKAGYTVVADQREKRGVLAALATSQIFHFAGHGTTHPTDPSQSALLLQDWDKDCLCVGDLIEQDLRSRAPFLAYLSACGTGRIQDRRDFDESVHLVSALQLAGFRHVIGTFWSVEDEPAAKFAERFYQTLFQLGLTDRNVCEGLHEATRSMRLAWLTEAENTRRGDGVQWDMFGTAQMTAIGPQLNWAAYMHFGC